MIKVKFSFDFEKVMPFIGLIIITVFFSIITGGKLLRVSNLSGILNQAIPIIIGGLGMIFVASQGSVDISQGSVLALSGTVAALMTSKYGVGILFPVAMLTGGVVGLFNGVILSKFKVSSLTVTLAVLISIRALVAFLTRGEVIYAPLEVLSIGNLSIKLPIFILIVLVIGYLFEYTKIGYYCKVLGENEVVGKYTGISVDKVKILAFMLSGIMAGIVGVFTVSRIGGVDPGMGNFFELQVLLALFVGGVPVTGGMGSKIFKLLVGAPTIAILESGLVLSGIRGEVSQGIQGIILILVVFLALNMRAKSIVKNAV